MKTKIKNILMTFLVVLLIFSLSGCGETIGSYPLYKEKESYNGVSQEIVAENSNLALKWNDKDKQITLVDKVNNSEWGAPSAEYIDENGEEKRTHPQVLSPIFVTYFDNTNYAEKTAYAYTSSIKKRTTSAKKIKNGISVTYDFKTECFSVTVDYTLKKDSINISIDKSKITETDKNRIMNIWVAPYFCGIPNYSEDSYLFVPSGSGALVYPDVGNASIFETSESVYGYDAAIDEEYNFSKIQATRLPVYGAKLANKGICAIIDSHEETTEIVSISSNKNVGFTTVFARAWVRGYDIIEMPELFGKDTHTKLLSDPIEEGCLSISYYPFGGENCSYIDMAEIYREYLFGTVDRKLEKGKANDVALNLEIIGGSTLTELFLGIPYLDLYKLTTIKEAGQIVDQTKEQVGNNFNVVLNGFGSSGLDIGVVAGGGKVDSSFGSNKQVKEFLEKCSDNGLSAFIDFDVVRYNKSGFGSSLSNDAAVRVSGKRITITHKDLNSGMVNKSAKSYRLTARDSLNDVTDKILKNAIKYKYTGISLGTLSNMSYADYDSSKNYARLGMTKQVQAIFEKYSEKGIKMLGTDANAYAAVLSDFITKAPLSSAQFDSFDETVPFYEIVFKGYIPMASNAVNSLISEEDAILRAVEAGIGVTFAVANEYDTDMKYSLQNISYVYNFAEAKESINNLKEKGIVDYYEQIKGATIENHKIISTKLRKTEFSNNVSVYVNFSDAAVQVDGIEIPAKSFKTVKEGE